MENADVPVEDKLTFQFHLADDKKDLVDCQYFASNQNYIYYEFDGYGAIKIADTYFNDKDKSKAYKIVDFNDGTSIEQRKENNAKSLNFNYIIG